jgi:hypothetical protein
MLDKIRSIQYLELLLIDNYVLQKLHVLAQYLINGIFPIKLFKLRQYCARLLQNFGLISLQTYGTVVVDPINEAIEEVKGPEVIGHELHSLAQKTLNGTSPINDSARQNVEENKLQMFGFRSTQIWLATVVAAMVLVKVVTQLLQDLAQYLLNGTFSTLVSGMEQ